MATTNGPHDNRSSGPRIGHETSGKSLRVMVVDGERLIRWSLATALEAQGHHVATAADADAALPALAAEPFDVVLLDCDSRDARDSEALDHIRLVSPDLPVVGMTAFGGEGVGRACELGTMPVLEKPFDVFGVGAILQALCTNHRA